MHIYVLVVDSVRSRLLFDTFTLTDLQVLFFIFYVMKTLPTHAYRLCMFHNLSDTK